MSKENILFSKTSDEKYYLQLYKIFKANIVDGKLIEGTRLSSVRQTAINYKVNMNTVLQAYNLLEQNGLIEKIPGKGCFVKKSLDLSLDRKDYPIFESFRYGQNSPEGMINFSNGTPSAKYFPIEIYKKLSEEVIQENGPKIFEYQNVQGVESFRVVLSEELEKDDIFVTEDDILITSGTQQSLDIILKLFSSKKLLSVALSDPTYPNSLNIFADVCDIHAFELEIDGWNMEKFEKFLKKEKIDFVYEVFNFQNPTGIKWSEKKKEKLLELAVKYDFYIIEDDPFSEFFYEGERPSILKSLDRSGQERVFYVRTYSKTIMPGISTAFIVAPRRFMEKAVLVKYSLDTTTSGLNQRILEKFISKRYLEDYIFNLKKIFLEKYEYTLKLLRDIPQIKILNIPKGGFFIWILLADHVDGLGFYEKCRERGVGILPGSVFHSDKRSGRKVRLTFVSCELEEIKKGIEIMKDILMRCKMKI